MMMKTDRIVWWVLFCASVAAVFALVDLVLTFWPGWRAWAAAALLLALVVGNLLAWMD